jgi:hypothetical protein
MATSKPNITFHNIKEIMKKVFHKCKKAGWLKPLTATLMSILVTFLVACMRVPKMVKNGFNSVLQTSAGSRRLVAARNSGTMRSPKLSPNHKRRIKTILDQFRNKHARVESSILSHQKRNIKSPRNKTKNEFLK